MCTIETSCFFTGHRILPTERLPEIRRHLELQIRRRIRDGVTDFYSGGAMGFDLLAALQVWNLQQEFPQIRLRMYLPFRGYENRWPAKEKELLHTVCGASKEVNYVSEGGYTPTCMRDRNEALVKKAHYGIAFRRTSHSGTAQTMAIAKNYGREVINLADLIYTGK